jgi:hypothetical protein
MILREEHKLRVFENRVLRRIFGQKRDGVMGGWIKLHNEELHNLYSSSGIIRIMKSRRNTYSLLVGKPEGKRSLGRPRHRWIDNIKMNLLETGLGGVDWMGVVQNR